MRGHEHIVSSCNFCVDDTKVLSGSYDCTVKLWVGGPALGGAKTSRKLMSPLMGFPWYWVPRHSRIPKIWRSLSEQGARSSSKVRAHSSVKSLERDEVSVAAVSLLTWKQWEQEWRPLDQELASFCWRLCLRVSELCHLSGSPHLEYSVPSTEMVCPCLGDHKRTEKWPNLGPVREGWWGGAGQRIGQCCKMQGAGAQEQGCDGQTRL